MKFNIWKDYPLKPLTDLLTFIVDNRGKSVPISENGKHVLIATNCIRNESLYPSYENIRLFDDEVYENWFRAHPLPGDVIFVNKGTPGRTCMVPEPVDFSIAQDMMAFRTNEEVLHNKYLLCVLRSYEIQEQIRMYSVGDVIPHFKKQFLKQLLIPVPPLKIQKYIADIYFSLSEKIEINKKINKKLDEQAQAVYHNIFDDCSIDTINISEIIDVRDGTHDSPKNIDSLFYLVTSKHLLPYGVDRNSSNTISDFDFYKINERSAVNTNDILISMIGTVGLISLVIEPVIDFAIKNVGLFRTSQNPKYVYYILSYLRSNKTKQHIDTMLAGSTQKYISLGELRKLPIPIPDEALLDTYNNIVTPMFEKIINNTFENNNLAKLRDTLIPRLMSGEIDVSSVEI